MIMLVDVSGSTSLTVSPQNANSISCSNSTSLTFVTAVLPAFNE